MRLCFNKNFFIVIDGIDDIIKEKEFENSMLWGMIKAANDFNEDLAKTMNLSPKVIIVIRKDLLERINDSNSNKIEQDCKIDLQWGTYNNDDLISFDIFKIIYNRFKYVGVVKNEFEFNDFINNYFIILSPMGYNSENINLNITEELFRLTANKPRDILMLFKYCSIMNPKKFRLSSKEFDETKKKYSREYFIKEIENDLASLLNDYLFRFDIKKVFKQIIMQNKSEFYEFSFNYWCSLLSKIQIDCNKSEVIFRYLFEYGYIGLVEKTISYYKNPFSEKMMQKRYVFKYDDYDLDLDLDINSQFVLHYAIICGYPKY